MASIQFTRNYSDRSNDMGYQFEFYCDRCGNGFMSQFRQNKLGAAGEIARGLGNVFGGVFGRAGYAAEGLERLNRGKAWDDAFAQAVTELKPMFNQCQRCGKWICKNVCFNNETGMCADCSPKREGEIEHAKSQAFISQVQQKAYNTDFVADVNLNQQRVVTCPRCGNSTGGAKFCPSCGLNLVPQQGFCPACGNQVPAGAKFCPGCGNKML